MKKYAPVFLIFLFAAFEAAAYQYSYVPKSGTPLIYNFTYRKREKCTAGKLYPYPKQVGVCASCPDGSEYLIDGTKKKAGCFRCPKGTLLVKRNGYPMCLSNYPVVDGQARKKNGTPVSHDELKRMARQLGADYTVSALPEESRKDTFKNRERLINVCQSVYPDDPEARRQVITCRKLGEKNDFLCPYVEKDGENKWICRACPKNAPYKKAGGGCFNCPYGEEMVMLEGGETVCASAAPPPPKKTAKAAPRRTVKKARTKTKKRR